MEQDAMAPNTPPNPTPGTVSRRNVLQHLGAAAIGSAAMVAGAGLALQPEAAHAISGAPLGSSTLTANAAVGATTVSLSSATLANSGKRVWLIFEPYSTNCEIRKTVSTTGTTTPGIHALSKAHAAGSTVLWTDEPIWNVMLFGAKGDNGGQGGNTTDDAPSINAAIDDAAENILGASGGVVFFPRGTYRIQSAVNVDNRTGIVLQGQGHNTRIRVDASPGVIYANTDIRLIQVVNSSNITIRDLRLTGVGRNYPATDTSWGTGIFVDNSEHVHVANCHVENTNSGIQGVNVRNCRFVHNRIEGTIAQDGIQLLGWNTGYTCEHNIIEGNTISATTGSNTAMGIRISGGLGAPSRYNVIANNVIHNVLLEALPVDIAEFNTWTGNTVSGCGYGMSIASCISGTIVGNVFKDCPAVGIYIDPYRAEHNVSNNVFDANIIVNCGTNSTSQDALRIIPGIGTGVQHNRFVNNYIEGGSRCGILVTTPWNSFIGNTVKSSGKNAIQFEADNIQVKDNVVINPGWSGIYSSTVSRAIISGNRVSGTNNAGHHGIFMNGTNHSAVSHNNVTGFGGGEGIYVTAQNANNVVVGNVCEVGAINVATGNIVSANFG